MFSALILFLIGVVLGYAINDQVLWDYLKDKGVVLINKIWK